MPFVGTTSPALKPGAAGRSAHAPLSLVVTAVEAGRAAGFVSFAPLAAFASLAASSFVRLRKMLFLTILRRTLSSTLTTISSSFSLTETMVLGIVALRAGQGKKILYDGAAANVTNVAAVNAYLTRDYRSGWAV